MKKILIAIVIIALTLLITPKFVASVVEDERQTLIKQLNEVDGLTVTSKSYSANWFGADASSEVVVTLEQVGIADVNIVLNETLHFGPVIISKNDWFFALGYTEFDFHFTGLALDKEVVDFINEKIHLGTLYNFNKEAIAHVRADEMSYEEAGTKLVSQPASGSFSMKSSKEFTGDFHWGGLTISDITEEFTIKDIAMSTHQTVVSGDYFKGTAILTGPANFTADIVSFTQDKQTVFSLAKAKLDTDISLKNELLALAINYHAQEVTSSAMTFKEPNLAVVLENIDLDALQELNAFLADVTATSEDNSEQLQQVLLEIADKLLAKEPVLKITDLSVITEQGAIASNFNFSIDEQKFDQNNLQSIIMAVKADGKGKAPLGFFTQFGVTPMIDNFVAQGYLTQDAEELSFDAIYQQGQLSLNGKALVM